MKRKEKENKNVVGEEGVENVDKKNKREVIWKTKQKIEWNKDELRRMVKTPIEK